MCSIRDMASDEGDQAESCACFEMTVSPGVPGVDGLSTCLLHLVTHPVLSRNVL